jgi:hypothetical protein
MNYVEQVIYEAKLKIAVSGDEFSMAVDFANRRNSEDQANGCVHRFEGYPGNPFLQNLIGVLGEISFSKFRRVPFRWTRMRETDVDGFEVRTSSKRWGDLSILPSDRNESRFALVVCVVWPRIFEIAGWITAREGRRVGHSKFYLGGPGVFVPQYELKRF